MWISGFLLRAPALFLPQPGCEIFKISPQPVWKKSLSQIFPQRIFPHSTSLVEKYEIAIDMYFSCPGKKSTKRIRLKRR